MASHLSMEERKRLSTLLGTGFSRAAVGRALGRAKSTITRELARNRRGWWYCPQQAQQRAERRRRQRPVTRKMDRPEIAAQVKRGLRAYHSPDQIAGRIKRFISDPDQRVSARTIYRWIRQQPPGTWDCYLRRYGRRKRGRKSRPVAHAVEIAGRPAEANERRVIGHWEGDTLVGPRHEGGVVTLVDRKSRYLLMARFQRRAARPVRYKLQKLLGPLPPAQRRSATFDRGHEFAEHLLLTARLDLPVFFAAPYSPWQRGTCEHTNGLIRQFFPKGTPLKTVSPRRIANVAQLLNHRPRKILNYLTPNEIFTGQPLRLRRNSARPAAGILEVTACTQLLRLRGSLKPYSPRRYSHRLERRTRKTRPSRQALCYAEELLYRTAWPQSKSLAAKPLRLETWQLGG